MEEKLAEEFQNQFEQLEISVHSLKQKNEDSQANLLDYQTNKEVEIESMKAKERARIVEENCLKEKLKILEEQKLREKIEIGEKCKSMLKDVKRSTAQGKIYQKESENARAQLNSKIGEILEVEARIKELEENLKESKEIQVAFDRRFENMIREMEDAKQELNQRNQTIDTVHNLNKELCEHNKELKMKIDTLDDEKIALKAQIKSLSVENSRLKAQIQSPNQGNKNSDMDLLVAQLNVEISELKSQLQQSKDDEKSLQTLLDLTR